MDQKKTTETIKLLCSYGGKILPRHSDGTLRYVGGLTRVLALDASISFAELMVKLAEFCGYSVELRCQLPTGDLETLISVKSDEDLANLIEENDRASSKTASSRPLKIRAILWPPKQISPSMTSTATCSGGGGDSSPSKSFFSSASFTDSPPKRSFSSFTDSPPPKRYVSPPVGFQRAAGRPCYYPRHVQRIPNEFSYYQRHRQHQHVHHCNDWR